VEGTPENNDDYDVSFYDGDDDDENYSAGLAQPEQDSCTSPQPSAPKTPASPVHARSRRLSLSSSQWLFQSHECGSTSGVPGGMDLGKDHDGDSDAQSCSLLDSRATHHPIRLFLHSPASSAASGTSSTASSASPSGRTDRQMWLRHHHNSTLSSSQSLLSTRTNASSDSAANARAGDSDDNNYDDGDNDERCDASSGGEDDVGDVRRENWRSREGRPRSSTKTASRSSGWSDRCSSNENSGTVVATSSFAAAGAATSSSSMHSIVDEDEDGMDGVVATIDTLTESVQSWSLVHVRSGQRSVAADSGVDDGDDDDGDQNSNNTGGKVRRRNALSAKKRVMRALRSSSSSSASLSSNPTPRARTSFPHDDAGASLPLGAWSPASSSAATSESHRSISSFFSAASSTRMLEG
jgi:hypothetical protein